MKVLIAGAGYVGGTLAAMLVEGGVEVCCVRRTHSWDIPGARCIEADLTDPPSLDTLPRDFTHVVFTPSADAFNEEAYRRIYVYGLEVLLAALRRQDVVPQRLVVASSTSVYEQEHGAWVDSDTPTNPKHFSGRVLLETEAVARKCGMSNVIVRIGHLYGPGRAGIIEHLRRGQGIVGDGQPIWESLVHRDDCARAIQFLLDAPSLDPIYVCVDHEPVARAEILRWAAARLEVPLRTVTGPTPKPGKPPRGNKRCDSRRLRESGFAFRYPTFREGLTPLIESHSEALRPPMPHEPFLAIDEIQGNILPGFDCTFETHLYLRVLPEQILRLHEWLSAIIPHITTTAAVLRDRRRDFGHPIAWLNLGLSHRVLRLLDMAGAETFVDRAFREGMAARSLEPLRDAPDGKIGDMPREGNRHAFRVGGPSNAADMVVIVASNDRECLDTFVARIETTIASSASLQTIHRQDAAMLPGPMRGFEHFGFRDGISQPGVRGRLSEDPRDLFTLRRVVGDPDQGLPGQAMIWPGEFVFGYPRQNRFGRSVTERGPDSLAEARRTREHDPLPGPAAPAWARDGSFLVIRHLRQDVGRFRAFLRARAAELDIGEELLAAKLMGRWRSGAPLLQSPEHDDPLLGADPAANNRMSFLEDRDGKLCPFAAHIRKAFPRDDDATVSELFPVGTPAVGEVTTQTHRLLRRGIPYGPPYDTTSSDADADRGLLFVCYQTSIEDQFEFVSRWMNSHEFKDRSLDDGTLRSGHDLVAGQAKPSTGGKRRARITLPEIDGQARDELIVTSEHWVVPTGGGYFFCPSIRGLTTLLQLGSSA